MKSIVKQKSEVGLWLQDSKVPECQSNEVLIKIKKTAICGTDLHIYNWDKWARKTVPVPLIIGHEFVGEIVEMGTSVKGFNIGDRVSGEGHITCGVCNKCRKGQKHLCINAKGIGYHLPGCFAEYFALPAENLFLVPGFINDDVASIFDPFGNAVHTALSFPLIGEDVLITGAGPIGMMAAAIAKIAGARKIVVTDINDYRLGLAKEMGATDIVNVKNITMKDFVINSDCPDGFSVGLEVSGNTSALHDMLKFSQHGAKIALLGIFPEDVSIDWDIVIFKMLTLKGIYGREIFSTWYKMAHLIETGLDLKPAITHTFDADDFEKAIDIMQSGMCGKVILNW